MEVSLTLVSTRRTIQIAVVATLVFIPASIMTAPWKEYQPFLALSVLVLGGLITYFALKKFARFSSTVNVTSDYIKVGKVFTISWDSILSYEYSDTGLLVGFIFRTTSKTYRITGLLHGTDGASFRLIKETIFKILAERESSADKNTIVHYNFYLSKQAKPVGYFLLTLCTGVIVGIIYWIIVSKTIKLSMIINLGIIGWLAYSVLRIYFLRRT
jgi:hypothetical protein